MIESYNKANSEEKNWPLTMSNTIAYTGAMYGLTDVPQGDTDEARDGDSLNKEHILVKYSVICADATNLMRVLVFSWGLTSTPVPGDVFSILGNAQAPFSYTVQDNKQLLHVYYDRLHCLSLASNVSECGTIDIPVKGKIQFNTGTTTGSNKIFICLLSDSAAATHPTFQGVSIFKFRDS
jgi:hypothetical protein